MNSVPSCICMHTRMARRKHSQACFSPQPFFAQSACPQWPASLHSQEAMASPGGPGGRKRPASDAEWPQPASKASKRRARAQRLENEMREFGSEHPGWVPDPTRPDRDEWRQMRDQARAEGYHVPNRPAGHQESHFAKALGLRTTPRPTRPLDRTALTTARPKFEGMPRSQVLGSMASTLQPVGGATSGGMTPGSQLLGGMTPRDMIPGGLELLEGGRPEPQPERMLQGGTLEGGRLGPQQLDDADEVHWPARMLQ